MPQLVEFMKSTAENIDDIILESSSKMPHITSISPENNSIVTIDETLSNIIIRFSLPMATGFGFNEVEDTTVPPIKSTPVWQDEYTLVIPLNAGELKADTIYGIRAVGGHFRSKEGYSLKEDFIYTFKTEL